MFLASSALDIRKTLYAHTCEIAEGGPTAQEEVMFVISVGRLAIEKQKLEADEIFPPAWGLFLVPEG